MFLKFNRKFSSLCQPISAKIENILKSGQNSINKIDINCGILYVFIEAMEVAPFNLV